jgi:hypothetical protein
MADKAIPSSEKLNKRWQTLHINKANTYQPGIEQISSQIIPKFVIWGKKATKSSWIGPKEERRHSKLFRFGFIGQQFRVWQE